MRDKEQRGRKGNPGRLDFQIRISHSRRAKEQQNKQVDKEAVGNVNGQIHQVIAQWAELAEVVVQGKGKKTDIAASGEIKKVLQIFDPRVLHDVAEIIKNKRNGEGIGVDQRSQNRQQKENRQRLGEKVLRR